MEGLNIDLFLLYFNILESVLLVFGRVLESFVCSISLILIMCSFFCVVS